MGRQARSPRPLQCPRRRRRLSRRGALATGSRAPVRSTAARSTATVGQAPTTATTSPPGTRAARRRLRRPTRQQPLPLPGPLQRQPLRPAPRPRAVEAAEARASGTPATSGRSRGTHARGSQACRPHSVSGSQDRQWISDGSAKDRRFPTEYPPCSLCEAPCRAPPNDGSLGGCWNRRSIGDLARIRRSCLMANTV